MRPVGRGLERVRRRSPPSTARCAGTASGSASGTRSVASDGIRVPWCACRTEAASRGRRLRDPAPAGDRRAGAAPSRCGGGGRRRYALQRAGLRRAIREGEQRAASRQAWTGGAARGRAAPARAPGRPPGPLPSRGAPRPASARPPGERRGPQDDVRQEPETPLGAEDELAQVRSGGRRRVRRHLQRPGRRLERAARRSSCSIRPTPRLRRPEPRAATQPPTVASSQDCGSWPMVRPRGRPAAVARSGPVDPGADGDEAAALVHAADAVEARRGPR